MPKPHRAGEGNWHENQYAHETDAASRHGNAGRNPGDMRHGADGGGGVGADNREDKEKMKSQRFGWLVIIGVFLLFIVIAYKTVDTVEATTDQYDIPEEIIESAERWGAEYHVSPELIESMAWYESNYNPYDVSPSGCVGILQVNPRWHSDRMSRCGVSDLYDVDENIHVGVDYLVEILENDTEELAAALAIYNGQPQSKVNAAIYDGYISKYAQAILDFAYELETLHGKHNVPEPDLEWTEGVG